MPDYYPASMDARAAWHSNWAAQLPALATKYGIATATMTKVAADNAWMQYWVQARNDADNIKQQLTKYFNDIAGSDISVPQPAVISFALIGTAPAETTPGIEHRTRDIVQAIKGSMAFSAADGHLLNIIPSHHVGGGPTPVTPPPDLTLTTLANFELRAKFTKRGMDAVKLQFRHSGGDWLSAGFLVSSPGTFAITPSVPGVAEQIEIRSVFLKGNEESSDYSDAKAAFIAP